MEIESKAAGRALADGPERASQGKRVQVWDPFVRAAHWLIVLLVSALVVSGFAGDQENHMALGIDILVLVLGRLLWGFVGDTHARFSSFVTGPGTAVNYLLSIARGRPGRYLGHNPAGGWMAVMVLLTLLILGVSGLILQAELEYEGWFVGYLALSDEAVARVLAAHQLAVWTLLTLIPLHLIGVIVASFQHRENLVGAMFTGYKQQELPPTHHQEKM